MCDSAILFTVKSGVSHGRKTTYRTWELHSSVGLFKQTYTTLNVTMYIGYAYIMYYVI